MIERALRLLVLGLGLSAAAHAAPLTEAEVVSALDARQPAIQIVTAELARARGQQLGAAGTFDTKIKGKADSAVAGGYDWRSVELAAEQQLPLYGALLSAGWRTGQGSLPIYYAEKQTNAGGELFVGLVLPLLEGGRTDPGRTAIDVAAQEQRAAAARARLVQVELQAQARTAYWAWTAAAAKLIVEQELLSAAEARDAAIQVRIARGDLAPIAGIDNQRAVLERRAEVALLTQKVRQSAIKLSLYWRDASGAPQVVTATEAPADPEPPRQGHAPVAELIEAALATRPEITELDVILAQLDAEIRLAKNQRAPSLDLVGRGSQDLGAGDDKLGKPELIVGVRLESPIQQRKVRGKLEELEAKRQSVASKQRLARDKVRAEVTAALAAVEATAEAYVYAEQAADAARAMAEGERARFGAGDTDLLTVYLREQSLAKAIGGRVDAMAAWHTALAGLDAAVGAAEAAPLSAE